MDPETHFKILLFLYKPPLFGIPAFITQQHVNILTEKNIVKILSFSIDNSLILKKNNGGGNF